MAPETVAAGYAARIQPILYPALLSLVSQEANFAPAPAVRAYWQRVYARLPR
ncbi:MAG: hypothetical protein AB1716_25065 [Planctomycetota bacterium]